MTRKQNGQICPTCGDLCADAQHKTGSHVFSFTNVRPFLEQRSLTADQAPRLQTIPYTSSYIPHMCVASYLRSHFFFFVISHVWTYAHHLLPWSHQNKQNQTLVFIVLLFHRRTLLDTSDSRHISIFCVCLLVAL